MVTRWAYNPAWRVDACFPVEKGTKRPEKNETTNFYLLQNKFAVFS